MELGRYAAQSKAFSRPDNKRVAELMETKKVGVFSHTEGVSPDAYKKFHNLTDFYNVLALSADHKGK